MPTRLEDLRLDAGLSQRGLAKKAGVDNATISRIESGNFKRPYYDTMKAIAEALGVEPEDIKEFSTKEEEEEVEE